MASKASFFEKVYEVAAQIPYGKVTSYGAIAKFLGAARSARMVGWAMNACHTTQTHIPAHRVVNRVGLLSGKGHFPSPTAMEEILESEGVKVKDNQVQNFEKHFWDPACYLEPVYFDEKN